MLNARAPRHPFTNAGNAFVARRLKGGNGSEIIGVTAINGERGQSKIVINVLAVLEPK